MSVEVGTSEIIGGKITAGTSGIEKIYKGSTLIWPVKKDISADFSATPLSGTVPLTVNFTDLSTNEPNTWYWDFGNGDTSTEQNPEYTYTDYGTYTVTLTASDFYSSDVETKLDYITISPNWTITEIQETEYETVYGRYQKIDAIDANHVAVTYSNTDGDGIIKIFEVETDGTFTEISSTNFYSTNQALYSNIVYIDSTHFALVFESGTIQVITYSFDASYNLTEIDHYIGTGSTGNRLDAVLFDVDKIFAADTTGFYYFTLDSSYNITLTDFYAYANQETAMAKSDLNTFQVACKNPVGAGIIATVNVSGSSIFLNFETGHDTNGCSGTSIMFDENSSRFVICYFDDVSALKMKVFTNNETVSAPVEVNSIDIVTSANDYTDTALAYNRDNSFTVTYNRETAVLSKPYVRIYQLENSNVLTFKGQIATLTLLLDYYENTIMLGDYLYVTGSYQVNDSGYLYSFLLS